MKTRPIDPAPVGRELLDVLGDGGERRRGGGHPLVIGGSRRSLQSPEGGPGRPGRRAPNPRGAARRRAARPAGRRSPGRARCPTRSSPSPRANGSSRRSRSAARDARPVVVDAHETSVAVRARRRDPDVAAGAAVQRGVVEQVVDEQPEAAVPAMDGGVVDLVVELVRDARMAAPGGVDSAASTRSPSSTSSRGRLSAASPRASACRPSSRWTIRSCSAAMSRTSASRSAASRPGLRASASRFARRPVSGVRSSWPASAAKRRVAWSARSIVVVEACSRASIVVERVRRASGPRRAPRRRAAACSGPRRRSPAPRRRAGARAGGRRAS